MYARYNEEYDEENGAVYSIEAGYEYTVGGKKYRGKRVAYGLFGVSSNWLLSNSYSVITKRYPSVIVYYHPRHHSTPILLTGLHRFHLVSIAVSVLIILFALYAVDVN